MIEFLVSVNMMFGFSAKSVQKNIVLIFQRALEAGNCWKFNSVKTFGNIICFRSLQKRVDEAVSLFGDKDAKGIVVLRSYEDYYHGYNLENGAHTPGYTELLDDLIRKFPLSEQIQGENNEREFVKLFGAILRVRNILLSFDQFADAAIISERDFQDYTSRYQDIHDRMIDEHEIDRVNVNEDIVFEMELVKSIDINIDYILLKVQEYRDSNCQDKELLVSIQKSIEASVELRSKKDLIMNFISQINNATDVSAAWREHVDEQREQDLNNIIEQENLNAEGTRKFLTNSFRDGEIRTAGTEIDKLLPPMSRFTPNNERATKKQTVIDRLRHFFDKYFNISGADF